MSDIQADKALFLQAGALGDSLFALTLADFVKNSLKLDAVDFLGRPEYTSYFPSRTCVSKVYDWDRFAAHRLFTDPAGFDIPDSDPLLELLSDYQCIVNLIGGNDSDFEKNLIFAVYCRRSADIATILTRPEKGGLHLADFFISQFAEQAGLTVAVKDEHKNKILVRATGADKVRGGKILNNAAESFFGGPMPLTQSDRLVIIAPGGGGLGKCWCLDNFLRVADLLSAEGLTPVFLLGPAEMERFSSRRISEIQAAAVTLSGLSLEELVGCLSFAKVFIGNDSGVSHLAGLMGIKTIAVFGPTDPAVYRPLGPDAAAVRDDSADFADSPSPPVQQKVLSLIR